MPDATCKGIILDVIAFLMTIARKNVIIHLRKFEKLIRFFTLQRAGKQTRHVWRLLFLTRIIQLGQPIETTESELFRCENKSL